ncbi:NlpC/P60 family protein [Streptomyces sp. NPDC050161]|uniref:C40 family peptidase n=1 Tax=Streptomyces sp. NPDC050161 TaxID=3365604 RepID=UPI0037AA357D
MSGRILRTACAAALIGAAALALPNPPVLADPGAAGTARPNSHDHGPGSGSVSGSPDGGPDVHSSDTGEGGLGTVTEGATGSDDGAGGAGTEAAGTDGGDGAGGDSGADAGAGADAEPAAPALPAAPTVPATPGTPAALLRQLQTLYRTTEASTEAFNATQEGLATAQRRAALLNSRLRQARSELAEGRADAGRLARMQYQGSGPAAVSSYLRVLLSKDPERAMDEGHLLREAAGGQAAVVARLAASEKRAATLARQAGAALGRQRALAERRKVQRDTVRRQLQGVERMLASLSGDQLAEVGRLENRKVDTAQRALLADGTVGRGGAPSQVGERALAYSLGQVGKPYVWGAAGPDAFDCSGLTSRAWSQAGRAIPRTSQEQWKRLPHVPLRQLRPGDLVLYFPGATHVALYAGDGKVVQAPRPGAAVKISPLASNPLLGAVRPDASSAPLTAYAPPRQVTAAASDAGSSDAGYRAASAPGA